MLVESPKQTESETRKVGPDNKPAAIWLETVGEMINELDW